MRSSQEWMERTAALALVVLTLGAPMLAAEEPAPQQAAAGAATAADKKPAEPSERLQETTHTLRSGGASLSYRALAGETVIRDENEKPTAKIFYVAYLKRARSATERSPCRSLPAGTTAG